MSAEQPSPEVLEEWIAKSWDRRPSFSYDFLVEMWREEQASRAKAREKDYKVQQLDELGRRVARLEKLVGPGGERIIKTLAKAAGAAISQFRAEDRDLLRSEIAKVDTRVAALEHNHLKFLGVHEPGRQYGPGNLVVRNGGLWHCHAATNETPGRSSDWQLAVKSGEVRQAPGVA